MTRTTAFDRAIRRIDTSNKSACWEWPGARMPKGYGLVRISAEVGNGYVHRVVYEGLIAPIQEGLQLDHLCRNPPCCNPSHLEPVTPRENLLRGESSAAQAARRNSCINGHEYTTGNTYTYAGSRQCRTCRNTHRKNSRQKLGR